MTWRPGLHGLLLAENGGRTATIYRDIDMRLGISAWSCQEALKKPAIVAAESLVQVTSTVMGRSTRTAIAF
jgi:hypothetical protein